MTFSPVERQQLYSYVDEVPHRAHTCILAILPFSTYRCEVFTNSRAVVTSPASHLNLAIVLRDRQTGTIVLIINISN
jgi:hypothetical protein